MTLASKGLGPPPRERKSWLTDREKLFVAVFFLFISACVLVAVLMVLPH